MNCKREIMKAPIIKSMENIANIFAAKNTNYKNKNKEFSA